MKDTERTVPVAMRSASSGGSAVHTYELRLDETPLLTRSAELRLGHRIAAASDRLGRLLLGHPAGVEAHLERLEKASRGMLRVVAEEGDRDELRRVRTRIQTLVKRDVISGAARRRIVSLLKPYPLEPEVALELGHNLRRHVGATTAAGVWRA